MPGEGAALLLSGGFEEARQMLERERDAASLDAQLVPSPQRSVGRGLHELAERLGADLMVIESCRRALLGRIFLGNHTIEALNRSPCAVAIATSGYAASAHRLARPGVGYVGSPESERALGAARELAARSGSMIRALSVVSLQSIPYGEPIPHNWPDVTKELMDDELRRLCGLADAEGEVSYGEPSEEL
jgi:nucleotide-binding universal stress UspA family protein